MAVSRRRRWVYSTLCTGLYWLTPPSPFFPFPLAVVVPGLLIEASPSVLAFLAANVAAVHFCWFQFWGRRWDIRRIGYLAGALGLCCVPYALDWWINLPA